MDPIDQSSDEPLSGPARRPGWLSAEPGQREMWGLGLILTLLSGLPFLTSWYPQMVDYPAHLARFHIMLSRDASPFLQQYYGFDWRWMGNLGADILIQPLASVMPLERAGWLIAALLPLITGLAILTVEWTLRKRIGLASILAFSFIWSPSLLLGFLNFMIAQALALFAFALWVRMDGSRWRAPVFIPVGLVVWLAHVSGWGILGLMVFGYEWHKDKSWRAFLAPWPLFFPLLALVAGAAWANRPAMARARKFTNGRSGSRRCAARCSGSTMPIPSSSA